MLTSALLVFVFALLGSVGSCSKPRSSRGSRPCLQVLAAPVPRSSTSVNQHTVAHTSAKNAAASTIVRSSAHSRLGHVASVKTTLSSGVKSTSTQVAAKSTLTAAPKDIAATSADAKAKSTSVDAVDAEDDAARAVVAAIALAG
jgi:hypothetical protein